MRVIGRCHPSKVAVSLDFSRRSAARLLRETELDAKDQPVGSGLITRLLIRGEHVG